MARSSMRNEEEPPGRSRSSSLSSLSPSPPPPERNPEHVGNSTGTKRLGKNLGSYLEQLKARQEANTQEPKEGAGHKADQGRKVEGKVAEAKPAQTQQKLKESKKEAIKKRGAPTKAGSTSNSDACKGEPTLPDPSQRTPTLNSRPSETPRKRPRSHTRAPNSSAANRLPSSFPARKLGPALKFRRIADPVPSNPPQYSAPSAYPLSSNAPSSNRRPPRASSSRRPPRVASESPEVSTSTNPPAPAPRQTRSGGAADLAELPWGYKGGGALLGKEKEVQAAARAELDKKGKDARATKRRKITVGMKSVSVTKIVERDERHAKVGGNEEKAREGQRSTAVRSSQKEDDAAIMMQRSAGGSTGAGKGTKRQWKRKRGGEEERVHEAPPNVPDSASDGPPTLDATASFLHSQQDLIKQPRSNSKKQQVHTVLGANVEAVQEQRKPTEKTKNARVEFTEEHARGLDLSAGTDIPAISSSTRPPPPAAGSSTTSAIPLHPPSLLSGVLTSRPSLPSSAPSLSIAPIPVVTTFGPARSVHQVKGYPPPSPVQPGFPPDSLPPLPSQPHRGYTQASTSSIALSQQQPAQSKAKPRPSTTRPKPPVRRDRDPALSSQEGWVVPERDLKIRPNGRPPVWAVGRQELCESLDYFKSYQGGHYDRKERCFGYLLDGFPSANDRCEQNGKIIISHGGGSSHSTAAGFVLHSDQERNNVRMRALQNCLDRKVPVMLLAGNQYSFFPRLRKMGWEEGGNEVRYAVLGAYSVTHIWAEGEPVELSTRKDSAKEEYFVRFKVRFEWVESQGTPWFTDVIGKEPVLEVPPTSSSLTPISSRAPSPPLPDPAMSPESSVSSPSDHSTPATSACEDDDASTSKRSIEVTCLTCENTHRAIYDAGISCYNETCTNFFRLPDGQMVLPASLAYDSSVLEPSSSAPFDSLIPQPVRPQTLQSLATSPLIRDYSRAAWRGFGCETCGRLSSRSQWLKLNCQECGAEVDATGSKVTVEELQKAGKLSTRRGPPIARGEPLWCVDPVRKTAIDQVEAFEGRTYELGGGSKVHHFWPKTDSGYVEADRLFEEYQGEAAGALFRRNPLNTHRTQGSLLCQQFTWNGGKEYLHAIAAETYPFDANAGDLTSSSNSTILAAPCAKEACKYLQDVVSLVVAGENRKETNFNEILSVAYMDGGKMSFHTDGEYGLGSVVASISLGSDAVMSFRPKESKGKGAKAKKDQAEPKDEAETASNARGTTKVILKLRLRHGDICVMEGSRMQKEFEHAVDPEGLRFAATARLVGPDHSRKRGGQHPRERPTAIPEQPSPSAASVIVASTTLPQGHSRLEPSQLFTNKPLLPRDPKPCDGSSHYLPAVHSSAHANVSQAIHQTNIDSESIYNPPDLLPRSHSHLPFLPALLGTVPNGSGTATTARWSSSSASNAPRQLSETPYTSVAPDFTPPSSTKVPSLIDRMYTSALHMHEYSKTTRIKKVSNHVGFSPYAAPAPYPSSTYQAYTTEFQDPPPRSAYPPVRSHHYPQAPYHPQPPIPSPYVQDHIASSSRNGSHSASDSYPVREPHQPAWARNSCW